MTAWIVALDVDNALQGLQLAERIGDAVSFYKIGLGMLTGGGSRSPTSSSRGNTDKTQSSST